MTCYIIEDTPPVVPAGRWGDRPPGALDVEVDLLMLSLVQNQKSPESANLL